MGGRSPADSQPTEEYLMTESSLHQSPSVNGGGPHKDHSLSHATRAGQNRPLLTLPKISKPYFELRGQCLYVLLFLFDIRAP